MEGNIERNFDKRQGIWKNRRNSNIGKGSQIKGIVEREIP